MRPAWTLSPKYRPCRPPAQGRATLSPLKAAGGKRVPSVLAQAPIHLPPPKTRMGGGGDINSPPLFLLTGQVAAKPSEGARSPTLSGGNIVPYTDNKCHLWSQIRINLDLINIKSRDGGHR